MLAASGTVRLLGCSAVPNRLVIVRHGESTWNAEERLQGQLDPPLSERGREQARDLGGTVDLSGFAPDRIISSDLARARETAELLGVVPARYERRWREIDIGEWGGRTAAEVDAEGDGLTNWRGGPRTAPDGEPWSAFAQRVAAAVDDLAAAGGSWLVISHGGCVRAACAHVTGADHLRLGSPGNASLTSLDLGPRRRLTTYGWTPGFGAPTGNY
jgi:glucosyl-3-phosphoglycerate phosphatase